MPCSMRSNWCCSKFPFLVDFVPILPIHNAKLGGVVVIKYPGSTVTWHFKAFSGCCTCRSGPKRQFLHQKSIDQNSISKFRVVIVQKMRPVKTIYKLILRCYLSLEINAAPAASCHLTCSCLQQSKHLQAPKLPCSSAGDLGSQLT